MKLICFTILLTACCAITVLGQNPQGPNTSSAPTPKDVNDIKDSRQLFEERDRLIDELRELEQKIDEQTTILQNLPRVASLEEDLSKAKVDLEKAEQAKAETEKIASLKASIETITKNRDRVRESVNTLAEKKAAQTQARRRLFNVEQRIAALFDATRDVNYFRAIATVTFGILVLIVVGGFYWIAWFKDGIAAKIFAGEMGMQFVTLFLIVIAIILFGIMGTLEGRELAALLGGLSGYILGKSGATPAGGGAPGGGNLPVKEPEAPVVKEPEPHVVKEPEAPVVKEPEAPVVKDPEPPVVKEPEPPVVKEPEPPLAKEPEPPVPSN